MPAMKNNKPKRSFKSRVIRARVKIRKKIRGNLLGYYVPAIRFSNKLRKCDKKPFSVQNQGELMQALKEYNKHLKALLRKYPSDRNQKYEDEVKTNEMTIQKIRNYLKLEKNNPGLTERSKEFTELTRSIQKNKKKL